MAPSSLADDLVSVVAAAAGAGGAQRRRGSDTLGVGGDGSKTSAQNSGGNNRLSVDAVSNTSRKSAEDAKRRSVEDSKRSSTSEALASAVGGGASGNGLLNGLRPSISPNGAGVNGSSSSSATAEKSSGSLLPNGLSPERDGGFFGRRKHSSSAASGDERQRQPDLLKPAKLAARDDGLFADNAMSTRESDSFLSSTHVSLSASNGDPPTPLQVDSSAESKTQGNGSTPEERSHPDQESLVSKGKEISTSPNSQYPSGRATTQVHRTSSPPALQAGLQANSNPNVPLPQPGKLQHRHTLEVPKISGSRMSRETTRTNDEAATATGRFSPIPSAATPRRASVSLIRKVTRTGHSDLHLDDAPPSEDADRWAELIRQRRASKRRKREDDDEDRVVMGTKVDQNHVNYVTAYNMLTGIRFTVSRTNAKLDRELTDLDFDAKHKFSFDITGNELTPSAKYDFKFKDYAPWVFRHLRNIFRLDPADYLMSLTSKYILSELGSPGKSGSFFYFSRDYKYIIKTIHHAEHKVLRKILREYYQHVKKNPNTLLSQFYGLHRVKIPYGRKIHFVVMNNLFPPHRDIHATFDLKGSTIGRDFKEDDLKNNPRGTLKDLNWLRRNMHLELGPTKKVAFIEQMQRDVALLQKLKIMDYSLLIGIHDLSRGNDDKLRDKTLQVFQPGGDKAEDQSPAIAPIPTTNTLMRTPSKLESARKAKELRETLMNEKPVPMGMSANRMPDEMSEEYQRKNLYFYSNDGGFRATHEDNAPGEQIYYLGIIDCLTHYGLIKRLEHFWKGLGHPESQISAIPPDRYSDRFIHFISGITKSKELVEQEEQQKQDQQQQQLQQLQQQQPQSWPSQSSSSHQPSNLPPPRLSITRSPGDLITPIGPSQQKADAVLERAERQAAATTSPTSTRRGRSPGSATDRHPDDPGVPDRHLATVQSPPGSSPTPSASAPARLAGDAPGKADAGATATLPVVEEVGESGSVGGRSARSSVGVHGGGGSEEERDADGAENGGVAEQNGKRKKVLTNGDVASSSSATVA